MITKMIKCDQHQFCIRNSNCSTNIP